MANPTTNYGFVLPTPTDLVTDLPADFDVALQGVDTRLKALQPGTTLGDLFYASATANTNTRLGIGSTGQVLKVAAGVPAWGADGGKVLQVVTATYATSTSNSTATYADTGLTATITPTLNTSKVLVLVYHNGISKSAAVNYQQMSIKLVRASTDILVSSGIDYTATASDASTTFAASILDSPATTSATTYKTTFNSAGVASVTIQSGGSTSTITLLEIGA